MIRCYKALLLVTVLFIDLGVSVTSTARSPIARPALVAVPTGNTSDAPRRAPQSPEQLLLESVAALRAGNAEQALKHVDALLEDKPTYRLAHLVRGDILASIGGQLPSISLASKADRAIIENLLAEARQRLAGTSFEPAGRVPAALLMLGDHHEHIVFIDTELSRLYVFANRGGDPYLVANHYISIGKNGSRKRRQGDKRTPLGVYFVTKRLSGDSLPDKYGPVAFPVDYPNDWDKRHKRTGDGIWVHGVASRSYSRPPLDSDGCVALINEELEQISPLMSPGNTPVIISNQAEWIDYEELARRRDQARERVEQWREDWESGKVENYLAHYDTEFSSRGMNLNAWRNYKRRVAKSKFDVSVVLDDLSIFAYPDEDDLMVVTFQQNYESNNFNGSARKRQYWRRGDDQRWRIVSES